MARVARLPVLVAVLGLVVSALGLGPVVRADSDPVAERATVTYRLDRQRARVLVTARYRWTNQIPSTATARYYLEQWGPIGVPTYAKDFRVKGRGVRAQRVPTGGTFDNVIVSFPRIYRGQSVSFTATWTLPSRGAGSQADVRVTDAYSYFCWTGQPVDGGSVTAIIPRALEAVTRGSAVRTSRQGSSRRISARQRGDLADVYACTDIYDPRLLVRREVLSPGGRAVTVEAWPGQDRWLDEATASVEQALTGLEAAVGAPLPGDRPVVVREVAANALMGYGGEFDPGSGIIRVGEAGASAQLLAHELAHTWFNSRTLSTNWLWEGLAEWTARQAAGRPCESPGDYPVKGKPRLGRWRIMGLGAGPADQVVVEWQYLAACSIMEQVAAAMGPDSMRDVFGVMLSGDSPYDRLPGALAAPSSEPEPSAAPSALPSAEPTVPDPSPAPSGRHIGPRPRPSALPSDGPLPSASLLPTAGPTAAVVRSSVTPSQARRKRAVDWRQWLDIVEEVGLLPAAAEEDLAQRLLLGFGIAKRSQLEGRSEAREAFHELQGMAPDGVTPAVVRRLMDDWEYRDARAAMRQARRVASAVAALPPGDPAIVDLWARYERATSTRALERLEQAIE